MPAVRWLLVIATAVLALGRPAVGYANAGLERDALCCCIDAEHCHCNHDRDGSGRSSMHKCGGGDHLVTPDLVPAVSAVLAWPAPIVVPEIAPIELVQLAPPTRTIEVEVPPF